MWSYGDIPEKTNDAVVEINKGKIGGGYPNIKDIEEHLSANGLPLSVRNEKG